MTLKSLTQYGTSFQVKVISSLLTHKEFLQNIHDILSDDYFDNQAHKWIVREILRYFKKYHTTPSMEVMKVELQKLENEILQISIKEQLKEAYVNSDTDLEYIEGEFASFCKNNQLKKALLSSVDLLGSGDYDSIRILIDNALKSGDDKNIGHEYDKDIESRYREESRITVPTPWESFNTLFQGGLGNGDFGLIFGNPGGGKSWLLVALGAYAVSIGYNVLHYTLELGEEYVGLRYDSYFTKIPVNLIKQNREKAEAAIKELPGKLILKEFPTGKATVSSLESHITKTQDFNFKPDLILVDYVDLLSSTRKSRERKEEIDDIYLGIKGLAKQLNVPIWSVSQVNRMGARDNIIEGDKAAGSYDKMMITDICLSLSRKREDKINGTGRFHIMKNRYGVDGLTFKVKADTSMGHFEVSDHEYVEEEEEQSNTNNNNATQEQRQLAQQFFQRQ